MISSFDPLKILWGKIPKQIRVCFFVGLFSGLITHLFMIANKIPNWDDVTVIPTMGLGPYGGRWFGDAVQKFFSKWSAPGVNGVWAVILMTLTACLVVDILHISSMTGTVFCAVLFQTFPVMASNMTFMFMTETFATAAFFMCLAVDLMLRFCWGWIPAVILQMLSLACYQAYFPLGVGVTVLALLRKLVEKRSLKQGNRRRELHNQFPAKAKIRLSLLNTHYWKEHSFLWTGFYCLVTLVGGMAVYLVSFRITTYWLGDFDEFHYRGIENVGKESPEALLHAFLRAYHRVIQFFITAPPSYFQGKIAGLNRISAVLLLIFFVLILVRYQMYRKPLVMLAFLVLAVLLPLSMGLIYLMSPETQDASTNMIAGYLLFYLVLIVLAELALPAVSKRWLAFALSLICVLDLSFTSYEFYKVDNTAYYRSYLANERVKAMYNRIYTKLEEQPGFTYDSPVLIAGDWWPEPNILSSFDLDGALYEDLDGLANEHGLMTSGVRWNYVRLFLGINSPEVSEEDSDRIMSSQEYLSMPAFPADGCIRQFGDIYVVKLAEE